MSLSTSERHPSPALHLGSRLVPRLPLRQHVRAPRTSEPACKPCVRLALTKHSKRSH